MKTKRIVQEIKVVAEVNPNTFEQKVNDYLKQGYELSSTSCGFANSTQYDFCEMYQAILCNPRAFVEDSNNA